MRASILTACILLMLSAALPCGMAGAEPEQEAATEQIAIMKTNRGDIVLRFFPEDAPEHVFNFVTHSKNGFYDGCLFHRVIPGFMIQGGDPNSKDDNPANDGMGGYSYKGPGEMLKAEFNKRKHKRGILSMARSQSPNSAGSQFFICHVDVPNLDGKYTVFGEVIDGIEVVDKIARVRRDERDRPQNDQIIKKIVIEEWSTQQVEEVKAAMNEAEASSAGK